MFYRPWQTVRPDPARSAALSAALGMPRLVCDVMCARGLDTPEAARAVCGGGDALSDPMLLSGMEAAVARIHRAIDDGERIAVFGDYDVDGVTATALLYTYLDSAGADVYYKLPSRDDDGYGLSETAVDLMAAKGVSLIVTVDNGVSANAAIAHAKEQGVDVVVTDHHLPPQTLPEAAAIVNPQLPGDESPCKTLSGAGVAFMHGAQDGQSWLRPWTAARRTRCCLFTGTSLPLGRLRTLCCLRVRTGASSRRGWHFCSRRSVRASRRSSRPAALGARS